MKLLKKKNEKSQGRYLPGDLMKHLETPRKTGRVSSYVCGACLRENEHLFRCRAQPEGKFSTLCTCTRSIVDANDAKIARSGDAQCNTKKSLSAGRCSFYWLTSCWLFMDVPSHFAWVLSPTKWICKRLPAWQSSSFLKKWLKADSFCSSSPAWPGIHRDQ